MLKKKILNKLMKIVDVTALALVIQTVNTGCVWHYHQPEIPQSALVYKKLKKRFDCVVLGEPTAGVCGQAKEFLIGGHLVNNIKPDIEISPSLDDVVKKWMFSLNLRRSW